MLKLVFALLLMSGLLPFVDAESAAAIKCNIDDLTRNCELFYENKKNRMCFSDGGCVRNPFFEAMESFEEDNKTEDITPQENFKDRSAAIKLLEEKTGPTDWFKIHLGNQPRSIGRIFLEKPGERVQVPWPPEKSDQKMLLIPTEEVRRYLEGNYSTKTVDKFKQIASRNYKPPAVEKAPEIDPEMQIYKPVKSSTSVALVAKTFEQAKEYYAEEIRQGRADSQLSENERRLIERIKSANLKFKDTCFGSIGGEYNPNFHTIYICPDNIGIPQASLLFLLGHELHHINDSCRGQWSIYTVDKANLEKFSETVKKDKLLSAQGRRSKQSHLKPLFEKDALMFNEAFDNEYSLAIREEMIKSGVIKLSSAGVENEKSPLANVNRCLVNIGLENKAWRDPSNKEVREMIVRYKNDFKEMYGVSKDSDFNLPMFRNIDKHRACHAISGINNKSAEVSCDWMAAKIVGRATQNRKFDTEIDKVSPFLTLIDNHCQDLKNNPVPEEIADDLNRAFGNSWGTLADAHPRSRSRLNHVLLAEPNIQRAIGCVPQEGQKTCNYIDGDKGQAGKANRTGGVSK